MSAQPGEVAKARWIGTLRLLIIQLVNIANIMKGWWQKFHHGVAAQKQAL